MAEQGSYRLRVAEYATARLNGKTEVHFIEWMTISKKFYKDYMLTDNILQEIGRALKDYDVIFMLDTSIHFSPLETFSMKCWPLSGSRQINGRQRIWAFSQWIFQFVESWSKTPL